MVPLAVIFLVTLQFLQLHRVRQLVSPPSPITETVTYTIFNSIMSHDGDSTLVSPVGVIESKNQFIPGVYKYGMNETTTLVIIGASITSDYHSPDKLWFQMYAMGNRMFDQKLSSKPSCYFTDEEVNATLYANGTLPLKPWKEMEDERFLCRIGTNEARFELMPAIGADSNTNEVLQVWRCPLRGVSGQDSILSDLDFQQLRQRPMDDMALAIDVLHEDKGTHLTTTVTKIHLPINEPNIGINQILSDLSYTIILRVGGLRY
jgi:hypothetical protein